MIVDGIVNAERFIEILLRLKLHTERKIFFVVDNLRVHQARIARERLEEHTDEIELFFLTS